jgi:hypothetical protein
MVKATIGKYRAGEKQTYCAIYLFGQSHFGFVESESIEGLAYLLLGLQTLEFQGEGGQINLQCSNGERIRKPDTSEEIELEPLSGTERGGFYRLFLEGGLPSSGTLRREPR